MCIKRFGVAVMDEGGEALVQEEAEAEVDADRRRLVDEARHRRVVNVLVQIAAKNEWPVFEGILENFRKKREFTPGQALADLKTAYRLQVKYQPSDFKVGLRRNMAKDQSAQLSDFEWQLLSRCLRPDQRHRAASRWHPLYAVVQHSWSLPLSEVTNDSQLTVSLVEQGLGLAYVLEPMVAEQLRTGRLQRVLESYAPTVPGFFLYYPSRAQLSPALRLFVDAARELAAHAL